MIEERLFPYVEIAGTRYPRLLLKWSDITGESGWVDAEEFKRSTCSQMVTEGYLFDVFESGPKIPGAAQKFVRTFASYEEEAATFGDRNVLPYGALTAASQDLVQIALIFMRGNLPGSTGD